MARERRPGRPEDQPLQVAVHVGQLLQPVPGGIGRYVERLVPALVAAGVSVTTFASGPRPASLPDGNQHVDLGPPRGALRYELWHRLRRPVVTAAGDLVHAPSLAVPPSGDRPLVVTVHDLVVLRQPEHLTPRRGVAFHRRGLELTRRHAEVVIVPTEFGRDDLVREGFDGARIYVAPHGVSPEIVGPGDDAEALRALGIRPPFLLFVSTIEPRKGAADVVEAHRRLRHRHPDLDLVVVGQRGWGPPVDLSGPGVHELGWLDPATVGALYRSAVALAHPERYAGFGLTPLEAMACGCPVVVADAACLPEVVGDGGIVVPTGDIGAMTDALEQLMIADTERRRWAAAGRRRASTFTWERSAAAHASAYASALAADAR